MLSLSVYTKLDAEAVLDRAAKYFIGQEGFHLVEYVAHFHADAGAAEIRVAGGDILAGDREHSSRDVLLSTAGHMEDSYGLSLVYYQLHFHAGSDEDAIGHLMVTVSSDDPVEVSLESEELDSAVKAFADGLPKAKTAATR